ncbi:MAG: rhomboid family intramembrane serine protease [Clostridium sp.]|nr:rhomboid family intramembrane serine protease [Clostridium sp.]
MNWIDRLERKYQRFAVRNLTKYLIIGTAFVLILSLFKEFREIDQILYLNSSLVLKGQIWRLITFIFVPPFESIWVVFALYIFYVFGSSLEKFWGSFRFNLYYLIGVLSAILAAFLGGKVTSEFLNMSIFLAFAYLYPNFKLLLFFILPVKVKYLAWFNIGFTVISIISRPESRITAVLSLANFFVFFGREIYNDWLFPRIKSAAKRRKRRKFKVITSPVKPSEMVYTCCICGRTSKDYPELKFSYCYKCGSDVEYCQDHLTNHEHIIKY